MIMAHNPLKSDPTRTATLRRVFGSSLSRRMKFLKKQIRELLVEEDALGLTQTTFNPSFNSRKFWAYNTRWQFLTDQKKIEEFRKWIIETSKITLFGTNTKDLERVFWNQYIEQAYLKGVSKSFADVRKPLLASTQQEVLFLEGSKQEFLRQLSISGVTVDKLKFLTSRVFTELEGVNGAIAQQLTRKLADGLVQGLTPIQISSEMNKSIDGISRTRLNVIARTEIVRAHAEGQLDSFVRLGVDKIGVMVEWHTASSPCPECAPLSGMVLKISEARGLIPKHPNCLCSYGPANIGESKVGQIRGKPLITKAVLESIEAESIKNRTRSVRTQKRRSQWQGSRVRISRIRPKRIN
jgi:hypothetical protein